ncbi:hypothetical protein N7535_000194 [Penicillium sp. DV-2018c]|nr:hypothetical protein N7461_006558 [Penicillium sp. DV-2018c]KAJ5581574.1 hypothetical protein N7535_000194 [Penicillium sp. DV-2018c]
MIRIDDFVIDAPAELVTKTKQHSGDYVAKLLQKMGTLISELQLGSLAFCDQFLLLTTAPNYPTPTHKES